MNDCIPVLLNMDVLAFSAACRILADERPFEAEPTTENLLKDKVYHYVHLLDVLKMEVEKAIYSDALRICKEYREWQTIVKTMDFFSWAERAGFYIPSAVEEWLNRNPENEREKHAAEWRELSKELKGKKKKKVALIAAEKCLGLSHQEAFRSALPDASFSNAKDYCQKNRKIAEELAKLYGMHMPDWNSES